MKGPTKAEREEHNVSHTPYREWCEACVRGSGMGKQHRRIQREDEDTKPTVSIDYGFLGPNAEVTEGDSTEVGDAVKFLVMKDRQNKEIIAHAVPCKGVADPYVAERVVRTLDEWGKAAVCLKSDGEPALRELK